jgi:hypothetical protein
MVLEPGQAPSHRLSPPVGHETLGENLMSRIQDRLARQMVERLDREAWETLVGWAARGPWRSCC